MNYLITGCAGFIGFHLAKNIINKKDKVFGIDNLNNYYDTNIKKSRIRYLKKLSKENNFHFFFKKVDLKDFKDLNKFIKKIKKIDYILHFAAQAGVRYSIKNPSAYIDDNIIAFNNLLSISSKLKIKKFLFASSSSVYGENNGKILTESKNTDRPLQVYAATKKCNEVIAYSYFNIYKMSIVALRIFTAYGPWGRPDMAIYKFTDSIYKNKPIYLYNKGKNYRDFTYVDDLCASVIKLIHQKKKSTSYEVFNIGNSKSISNLELISKLEKIINKKTKKFFVNQNKGEMTKTLSSTNKLKKRINYSPKTNINVGLKKFVEWYQEYHNLKL
jgi:UDP-glucuronate 4-epimerase